MQPGLTRGLLLFAMFMLRPFHVYAQTPIEIIEQDVEYVFNDHVSFSARFTSVDRINEGYVFYQFSGNERIWVYEGDVSEEQTFYLEVELEPENSPQAFSTVTYWFRFGSDFGDFYESERYSFYYEDNRYAWQTLERSPFTLRWHNGDLAFAESIIRAAELGVSRAQALLPLPAPSEITFQIYDNPADVQLVAQSAGYSWVAGHSDPASDFVLLSLPPGVQQSLEIERQVPHEVAHLMLYQALGADAYDRLPPWLDEGIASNLEIYTDPLRAELLEAAFAGNALIPLYQLCAVFPQDSVSARLAYAQSASFVRYLHQEYGSVGLGILLDAYANHTDCLGAPLESFDKDLLAFENDWRAATFDPPQGALDLLQALPWQTIFLSAVIALGVFGLVRRASRLR